MGTRSHLSLALKAAAASLALAACIDFVEPEIPAAGAPATIQAAVVVTDTGVIELSGQLVPGLDDLGVRRPVLDDAIRVEDEQVRPSEMRPDGRFVYDTLWTGRLPPPSGTRVTVPSIDGVAAAPEIRWYGIRRAGPDTLVLGDAELRIPLTTDLGVSQPVPAFRQWFLTIASDSSSFRLGGDGVPPDTIRVPSYWIPSGNELRLRLIYSQSGVVEPAPGDYIASFVLDTRLFWTMRRAPVIPSEARTAS